MYSIDVPDIVLALFRRYGDDDDESLYSADTVLFTLFLNTSVYWQ